VTQAQAQAEAAFAHFLTLMDEGERAAAYQHFIDLRNADRQKRVNEWARDGFVSTRWATQ
jgi:hypothetical protein